MNPASSSEQTTDFISRLVTASMAATPVLIALFGFAATPTTLSARPQSEVKLADAIPLTPALTEKRRRRPENRTTWRNPRTKPPLPMTGFIWTTKRAATSSTGPSVSLDFNRNRYATKSLLFIIHRHLDSLRLTSNRTLTMNIIRSINRFILVLLVCPIVIAAAPAL